MQRLHLIIHGKVQGVFFRQKMKDTAAALGVKGWVRNLPDGTVEAVVEGEASRVQALAEWCHRGPPIAKVEKVEQQEEPCRGEFTEFSIIY